ncbi:MAG TPA: DUF2800 domain-containing protein [Paludibacteraceae bacterium]|nr:DUF2800 domain-containing protein [Paludibacteraceae bacterium]
MEKKLLVEKIDLDLVADIADVYERAKNTIKYLADFCESIEARVKSGEKIERFILTDGNKTRYITDLGVKVLEKALGEKLYNKKVIGITELENLVGREKINEYLEIGIVAYKEAPKKVVLQEK